MTEPERIRREPGEIQPAPSPSPAAIEPVIQALKNCPHCRKSLTPEDVTAGVCWYCDKGLTDVALDRKRTIPLLRVLVVAGVGAMLGCWFTLVHRDSWQISVIAGGFLGWGIAMAIAVQVFKRDK